MTVENQKRLAAPFAHVEPNELGYNVKQVDEFLDRARAVYTAGEDAADPLTSQDVRATVFDAARGGYRPDAVDAALDRLEDVFAQQEKDELIAREGEEAWLQQLARMSALLLGRLHRPDGERFRRPRRAVPSYSTADVDDLCHQLVGYFESNETMSVDTVRRAVFSPAKGKAGYEESQVDAFLDRVVELMAGID